MDKSRKMLIIVISLLVVLLAVIVGGTIYIVRVLSADGTETVIAEPVNEVKILDIEQVSLESPLNINLLDSPDGSAHAVTINVSVGVDISSEEEDDVALVEKIRGSEDIIADVAISVIRTKTYEDIKTEGALDLIKQEILEKLQDEFKTNLICKVYISNIYHI
ncbi:MAG: flagellar basal body-associated FliL family protein [Clostridiales bacterium]|nr:flagellar basal body-associated FliL family protein [Clostridiales bacterium]